MIGLACGHFAADFHAETRQNWQNDTRFETRNVTRRLHFCDTKLTRNRKEMIVAFPSTNNAANRGTDASRRAIMYTRPIKESGPVTSDES